MPPFFPPRWKKRRHRGRLLQQIPRRHLRPRRPRPHHAHHHHRDAPSLPRRHAKRPRRRPPGHQPSHPNRHPRAPPTTTTATLEAFLDGKQIDLFDGQSVTKQVTQTVTPTLPALALVAVNTPLPFITAQARTASTTPRRVPAQREVDAAPPRIPPTPF